MEHWIEEEPGKCHWIVNTGMHGLLEAHKNSEFKQILNSADFFASDGFSVLWIARRNGFSLEKRVTPLDLIHEFCKVASNKGYKSFFYGDTEEVQQSLKANLKRQFTNLRIVGTYSPPFRPLTPEEDEKIVQMINKARSDVLWVALGLPKQERWIFEHRDRLDVPVVVGVGAVFKFLSNEVKPAPAWLGDHGLEWIWRLIQEPRRLWRRVFIYIPHFIVLVILEMSGLKKFD
ncbi:WecB/TagA/CpsF family glycosyltransferase [candidate division WOR-3 bacterium]|nr:WecB/TagA/CpsF family glycosyltransferase [candidate division WOR-3 bacterium]